MKRRATARSSSSSSAGPGTRIPRPRARPRRGRNPKLPRRRSESSPGPFPTPLPLPEVLYSHLRGKAEVHSHKETLMSLEEEEGIIGLVSDKGILLSGDRLSDP